MYLVVLGGFFAVAALIVVVGRAKRLSEVADWDDAAKEAGLVCHSGGWAGETTIHGRVDGHEVSVRRETQSRGSQRQVYTAYKVRYRRVATVSFELRAEGLAQRFGKLFGGQDIRIGHRMFDEAVCVRGRRARQIVEFLTPERRARILGVLSSEPGCVITGSEIRLDRLGVDSGARVIENLRRLSKLADILTTPPNEEQPIERVLRARRSGDLGRARELARELSDDDAAEWAVLGVEPEHGAAKDDADRPRVRLPKRASRVRRVVVRTRQLDRDGRTTASSTTTSSSTRRTLRVTKTLQEREVEPVAETAPPVAEPPDFEPPPRLDPPKIEPPPRLEPPPIEPPPRLEPPTVEPPVAPKLEPTELRPIELASANPEPLVVDAPPAEAEPAPPAGEPLDVEVVCQTVFAPSLCSFDAQQVFEHRFDDQLITWSGRLERVEPYGIDLVFGDGPGLRCLFELCEVDATVSISATVQAIVQLPAELEERMRELLHQDVTFSGQLVHCDPLVRNLYVASGQLA